MNRMKAAPAHEALVVAAFGPAEQARAAFEEWSRHVDVQSLDFASQRLLPLVARRNDLPPGPDGLDEQLRRITRFIWIKTQYLIGRVAPVLGGLRDAGIPAMLMKGAGVVAHTGIKVAERPMNDFDIMVPLAQAPEAVEIVRKLGFTAPGFPHDPYRTNVYEEIDGYNFRDAVTGELDLHWGWSSRGLRPGGTQSWWEAAQESSLRSVPCLVACREDLVLQAITHATLLSAVDTPSRWLPDTALLVRSAGEDFDWGRLVNQAKAFRLSLAVADAIEYAASLGCISVPDEVSRALDEARARAGMLERIELRPIPPVWLKPGRLAGTGELLADEVVAWHRRTFPPLGTPPPDPAGPIFALAGAAVRRVRPQSTRSVGSAFEFEMGEEVPFGTGIPELDLCLIKGWYTRDDSGVWTGRRALLRLHLRNPAPGPLSLKAIVVPLVSPARPELKVIVRSGRFRLATWSFEGTSWRSDLRTVLLPIKAGASEIQIRFSVDHPASPHALGIDGDIRILGLHLISLRLDHPDL